MHIKQSWFAFFCVAVLTACMFSCKKIDELTQPPDIQPLRQGFQTCAVVGYCASIASAAFTGAPLPNSVQFDQATRDGYTNAGILHITIDDQNPLPFNKSLRGQIHIAGLWDTNSGVISIVFTDLNLFNASFYGMYTIPVTKKDNGEVATMFAEEDIILGTGSDTLLNLSLLKPKFTVELDRLNGEQPVDEFVAVTQNVWFMNIGQNETPANVYDDNFEVNGGGQILSAASNSGGVLYHAMIGTTFNYNDCSYNPGNGTGFIQNIKASGTSVDLGNITLGFHNTCDGRANVKVATGKYVGSNGKNISLNFN
jgi:hypothetical protein